MKLTKGILCRDDDSDGAIVLFLTDDRSELSKRSDGFWDSDAIFEARCLKEWKKTYDCNFPTPRKGQCVGEVWVEL